MRAWVTRSGTARGFAWGPGSSWGWQGGWAYGNGNGRWNSWAIMGTNLTP